LSGKTEYTDNYCADIRSVNTLLCELDAMEKLRTIELLHVAGSIASVTGISLLAIGGLTTDNQLATIFAYSMSASIFIGILALLVFIFRYLYPQISNKFGSSTALAISAVIIPLTIWLNFYLILLLKALAQHEFLWLLEQISR